MSHPPIPENDAERVAALRRHNLLDTPPEPAFDRITRAVARLLGVPTALVTLVDKDRQWFKSRLGLEASETPRELSFCAHVVARREPMIVLDTHKDNLFADHSVVVGPPKVRFYAGAPLITSDGYALGTLCAVDYAPRPSFSDDDRQKLVDLAGAVVDAIESRAVSGFLRAQTQLLQTTVDAIDQGISAFDANLKLTVWNRKFLQLFDLPDSLGRKGTDYSDILRAVARQDGRSPEAVEAYVSERIAVAVSWTNRRAERRRPNGRIIEICSVPLPGGGMVNTYADVTELRQRTAALEQQARLFRLMETVAETANQASTLATALQHVVDEVCTYTGWPIGNALIRAEGSNELIPTDIWRIADPRYAAFPELTRHFRFASGEGQPGRVMASRRLEWIADMRPITSIRRGKIAMEMGMLACFGFPVMAGDEVCAVLQFFNSAVTPPDPAMFPVMEFATAQLSRVAERELVARMKNEFISTVSHELRTPLTSISGSLELIEAGVTGPLAEQTQEMVRIAYQNSQRLIRLINDILDIEKIESGRMTFERKLTPLRPLVERAISETDSFAAGFKVTLHLAAGDDLSALVDTDRFIQVVTNLLSNAAKFSPSGGTVDVTLVRHEAGVRLSVADRGPGIPETFQKRLFEKFAQADSSDRRQVAGTGLGLAIVKSIVERLDGTISFETAAGKGTTFHVDLLDRAQAGKAAEPGGRPRALVIEDDIASARLLEAICRDIGCDCDVAHSTVGARRLLAERQFGVILTDVMLPGQSGIDFIKELRASGHAGDVPVIVVSSEPATGEYGKLSAELGIIEWVEKPIDAPMLMALVQRTLPHAEGRS